MRLKLICGFIWLGLMSFHHCRSQASNQTFKVINYNTLHGFASDSATRLKFTKWVKGQDPDLVVFEEMIGFSVNELREFAAGFGHHFSAIMSPETGHDVTHPLAISSRYPIQELEMANENMWHGYLLAKVAGIYCLVTHLAPFTLKDRQQDITRILARIDSLPREAPLMIAGDFNAFARFDSSHYGADLRKSMARLEGRLEPKSGTAIVKYKTIYRNNLNKGAIDFSVTDQMLAAGFQDAYYLLHKSFKNSVPVKSRMKKNSFLRRVDYIWVNENLAPRLIKADILQDTVTDRLSDHYPVLAVFKR
ncbi:endonuclease/exonuclease/phosphatase family protein [Niabella terrae]